MTSLRIDKLERNHAIDAFDCGREALNRFLIRYALQNQQAGASQSYVALADEEIVGYYTLVVGQVEYNDAPERLTKGLARHPVPIMLLARLAISISRQGKGLGAGLLKDAMLRTIQAADIALRNRYSHAPEYANCAREAVRSATPRGRGTFVHAFCSWLRRRLRRR